MKSLSRLDPRCLPAFAAMSVSWPDTQTRRRILLNEKLNPDLGACVSAEFPFGAKNFRPRPRLRGRSNSSAAKA
jgi:hypothetical protein